jgi:hypothetical protein
MIWVAQHISRKLGQEKKAGDALKKGHEIVGSDRLDG